ncbi:MAG: hypothetical protein MUO19_00140 [Dehalococcoidales bacterium]|nr:hypothetical protein [Dehalococcoidales bacterium]
MAGAKYGHLIKNLSVKDFGPGLARQGTEMNGQLLGYDVNVQYGAYWAAGKMGQPPIEPKVHDYDQVMIWMGTDTYDMGYLGAEVELCLGEEKEMHRITTATAVAVPQGTPYMPGNITRMDDRFIFMTVSPGAGNLVDTGVDGRQAAPAGTIHAFKIPGECSVPGVYPKRTLALRPA